MIDNNLNIIVDTTIRNGKIYIPTKIKKMFKLDDGTRIAWCIDSRNNLVIRTAKLVINEIESDDIVAY